MFASSSSVLGLPIPTSIAKNKPKTIVVLVDWPNPLSIRCTGTVSSTILGVAETLTPAAIENMNLPANINVQLSQMDINVVIRQTMLQMMLNVGSSYITYGTTKYYVTMLESVLYYLSATSYNIYIYIIFKYK